MSINLGASLAKEKHVKGTNPMNVYVLLRGTGLRSHNTKSYPLMVATYAGHAKVLW